MQVEHEESQCVVVFWRKAADELMQLLCFHCGIFPSGGRDELLMEIVRQQGYRKRAEVGLEHRRHRTDIVESVGIPEIKRCIVSSVKELHDRLGLARASRFAVDPLKVERQRLDCFYALFYDDGNLALAPSQVSSDLVSEVTTEYRMRLLPDTIQIFPRAWGMLRTWQVDLIHTS